MSKCRQSFASNQRTIMMGIGIVSCRGMVGYVVRVKPNNWADGLFTSQVHDDVWNWYWPKLRHGTLTEWTGRSWRKCWRKCLYRRCWRGSCSGWNVAGARRLIIWQNCQWARKLFLEKLKRRMILIKIMNFKIKSYNRKIIKIFKLVK